MSDRVKVVPKPWGRELWWARSARYVGKIIFIRKGHRLSLQYHRVKHESVYVQSGRLALELGGRRVVLGPGRAFAVRPGTRHRFGAPFGPVTLLEVSTPQLSDVVRLADDYGRGPAGQDGRKKRRMAP